MLLAGVLLADNSVLLFFNLKKKNQPGVPPASQSQSKVPCINCWQSEEIKGVLLSYVSAGSELLSLEMFLADLVATKLLTSNNDSLSEPLQVTEIGSHS